MDAQTCAYHVKEVHHACPSLQIPHVHVAIVTSGQHDPGVEGMRLQDKHLSLVALQTRGGSWGQPGLPAGHIPPRLPCIL